MNALWMRVVANIGNRKITWRAVTSLGLPRAAAVGHLVMLWGGALEAETNGYVDDIPDAQLEAWAGWDGAPGAFAAFVREHHVSDGRINEWDDWAGVLESQRERERTKKAAQRDAKKAGTSPRTSRRRPADTPGAVPGEVPGTSPHKERKGKEGIGSSTTSQNLGASSDAPAEAAAASDAKGSTKAASINARAVRPATAAARHDYPPEFEAVWAIYPPRLATNSKHEAFKKWQARRRAGVSVDELHAGVERYRAQCAAKYGPGPSDSVMQGMRFFGDGEHYRAEWPLPVAAETRAPGSPALANDPVVGVAHRLWTGFKSTGILRAQTPTQYTTAAEQLIADGAVVSIDDLRTIWKQLDKSRLLDAQRDTFAEAHLADVLRAVWPTIGHPALSPAA